MTYHYLKLWQEARTRFEKLLMEIDTNDLKKKLGSSPNSVGFLIRHIAEVELLFAKNVFGLKEVKITAKNIIEGKDTGKWNALSDLKAISHTAKEKLKDAIENQKKDDWQKEIETKEFGKKSLTEAFGRVVSHTAYHAGQMAIIIKYGKS